MSNNIKKNVSKRRLLENFIHYSYIHYKRLYFLDKCKDLKDLRDI